MILYHGSNVEINNIDLSKSMPYKDFGRGFYLTTINDQSEQMAKRTARFYGGVPVVTEFEIPDDLLVGYGLNVRVFNGISEEWANFIINNRNKNFVDIASPECNTDGKYDVVFGPVGNDDVTFLLRQYTRNMITVEQLKSGLEFKRHRISTHFIHHAL